MFDCGAVELWVICFEGASEKAVVAQRGAPWNVLLLSFEMEPHRQYHRKKHTHTHTTIWSTVRNPCRGVDAGGRGEGEGMRTTRILRHYKVIALALGAPGVGAGGRPADPAPTGGPEMLAQLGTTRS